MNMSETGAYVCANYLPAGNMMMPGEYPKNVMPSSMGTDFDEIVAAAPAHEGAEEEEEEEEEEEPEEEEEEEPEEEEEEPEEEEAGSVGSVGSLKPAGAKR